MKHDAPSLGNILCSPGITIFDRFLQLSFSAARGGHFATQYWTSFLSISIWKIFFHGLDDDELSWTPSKGWLSGPLYQTHFSIQVSIIAPLTRAVWRRSTSLRPCLRGLPPDAGFDDDWVPPPGESVRSSLSWCIHGGVILSKYG